MGQDAVLKIYAILVALMWVISILTSVVFYKVGKKVVATRTPGEMERYHCSSVEKRLKKFTVIHNIVLAGFITLSLVLIGSIIQKVYVHAINGEPITVFTWQDRFKMYIHPIYFLGWLFALASYLMSKTVKGYAANLYRKCIELRIVK